MNYLLDFKGCFYCVFFVGHFDFVGFTFFELQGVFVQCLFGNTVFVGFDLVGFAVDFEFDNFAFLELAVYFEFGF